MRCGAVNDARHLRAGHLGHAQINDDDIGLERSGFLDGFQAVFRLAANFPAFVRFKEFARATARRRVVVYNKNSSHSFSARLRVAMLGILRCAVPDRNTVDGVWTEFSDALRLSLSFRPPVQGFLYARGIEMNEKSVLEPIEAERTGPHGHPVTNNLLLSLPDHEFDLVRGELEFLDLPDHLDLHLPVQDVQYAYFPNRGMISLVVATEDGRTVEVGVVGREGFSGAALAVGLRTSSVREVVQIAGDGFRIGAEAVAKLMRTAPEMRMTMGRYAVILGMQISQTAACNRLHTVEQRLARWLLVTRDRVDSGFLPITHDFLATMLGTDRPTVSLAASTMQKQGILEYKRGAVKIVDRKKLQERACECYQVIEEFNPVLGIP